MVSYVDADPLKLNKALAQHLKNIESLQAPDWSQFVKTGNNKVRPPIDSEWWYARSASLLVTMAKKGPIGVNKLRVLYGGRKRRGYAPPIFALASGNIIRTILQQLEKAGLLLPYDKNGRKGRIASPAGLALISKAALEVSQ